MQALRRGRRVVCVGRVGLTTKAKNGPESTVLMKLSVCWLILGALALAGCADQEVPVEDVCEDGEVPCSGEEPQALQHVSHEADSSASQQAVDLRADFGKSNRCSLILDWNYASDADHPVMGLFGDAGDGPELWAAGGPQPTVHATPMPVLPDEGSHWLRIETGTQDWSGQMRFLAFGADLVDEKGQYYEGPMAVNLTCEQSFTIERFTVSSDVIIWEAGAMQGGVAVAARPIVPFYWVSAQAGGTFDFESGPAGTVEAVAGTHSTAQGTASVNLEGPEGEQTWELQDTDAMDFEGPTGDYTLTVDRVGHGPADRLLGLVGTFEEMPPS